VGFPLISTRNPIFGFPLSSKEVLGLVFHNCHLKCLYGLF
jgi:hypothetical protein